MPEPIIPQIKDAGEGRPLDFSETFILPEIQSYFPDERITVQNELKWFLDQKDGLQRQEYDPSLGFYGSRYWDAFDKVGRLGSMLETKASSFLQTEDLGVVTPLYLSTRASNSGLSLESLIPNEDGRHYLNVEPSAILSKSTDDRGVIDKVGYDRLKFPFLNRNDTTKYDKKPLSYRTNPEGTGVLFFSSPNEFHKKTKLFEDLYTIPKNQSLVSLAVDFNNSGIEDEDKIPIDMLPMLQDDWMIRRDVTGAVRPALEQKHLKGMPKNFGEIKGEEVDPFEGATPPPNVISLTPAGFFFKPFEFAKIKRANREQAADDYWSKRNPERFPDGVDYWPLKWHLMEKLQNHRWAQLSDDEKQQLKTLGGAAAQFLEGIPTDINHLATDNFGNYNERQKAVGVISQFLNGQSEMMSQKFPYNREMFKGAGYGSDEGSPYDIDLNRSVESINMALQKMSSQTVRSGWMTPFIQTQESTKEPEGMGYGPLEEGEDPEKVLNYLHSSTSILEGMGLAGASQEEMNNLLQMLVQHSEILNASIAAGEKFKSFGERSKPTYEEHGKTWAYDQRFRRGIQDNTAAGNTKNIRDAHRQNIDPNYKMIKDFIDKLENFVVISGSDGQRITPVMEWLGMASYRGKKYIPLKLNELKLLGTDVKSEQHWGNYGNVIDPSAFGITYPHWPTKGTGDISISGGAPAERKAKTTIKKESPLEKVSRQRTEADIYPERDTNKDGIVSKEEHEAAVKPPVIKDAKKARATLRSGKKLKEDR